MMPPALRHLRLALLLLASVLSGTAAAQFGGGEPSFDWDEGPEDDRPGDPEFVFLRGKYENYGGQSAGPGRGWWETDFPDSDKNFLRGVRRYTRLDANSEGYRAMDLTDPELFEYSFLYLNMKRIPINVPSSGPNFSEEEANNLREFMLRGGFVLVDDFWGDQHWKDFLVELAKIFPERDLQRLDVDHPIFHNFFDVEEIHQIPGRSVTWNYNSGFYLDDPDFPPAVHAVFDDDGRAMLVANFNTDLGDGWEHTFYEPYPTRYINEAYKVGINYIIYSLTH